MSKKIPLHRAISGLELCSEIIARELFALAKDIAPCDDIEEMRVRAIIQGNIDQMRAAQDKRIDELRAKKMLATCPFLTRNKRARNDPTFRAIPTCEVPL